MKKLVLLTSVCSLFFFTGCKDEEKGFAKVVVTVTNSNGVPVQNAMVRMFAPTTPETEIDYYKATSIGGVVEFQWKYQVYVTMDAAKGGFRGCNSGMLMPGETAEIHVIMLERENPANGCID